MVHHQAVCQQQFNRNLMNNIFNRFVTAWARGMVVFWARGMARA